MGFIPGKRLNRSFGTRINADSPTAFGQVCFFWRLSVIVGHCGEVFLHLLNCAPQLALVKGRCLPLVVAGGRSAAETWGLRGDVQA